jgi:serpin B
MKKIMMAIAPLLILTSCANQASLAKLNKFALNKPNKAFNTIQTKELNKGYIDSLKEFSLDFFQQANGGEDKNPVFSPMSIATCFSMAYDAADGETKKELGKLLHYDEEAFNHLDEIKNALLRSAINDAKKNTYLNISQSFWTDDNSTIHEDYLKTLQDYYFAEAYQGDLPNMYNEVADWINDKTKHYLNVKGEDFQEMLASAIYALINTVYLKSAWVNEFKEELNYQGNFANLDATSTKVTYMETKLEDSYYFTGDGYVISSLPFEHDLEFRMLLPNVDTDYAKVLDDRTALDNLLALPLDKVGILENASGITQKGTVEYTIPQFKVRSIFNLVDMFIDRGIKTPFKPGCANFPKFDGGYISKAQHEAGFETNNKGAEGAAYTIIVVSKAGIPEEPVRFTLDRPFAYAVTTKEGIPVFRGKVTSLPNA